MFGEQARERCLALRVPAPADLDPVEVLQWYLVLAQVHVVEGLEQAQVGERLRVALDVYVDVGGRAHPADDVLVLADDPRGEVHVVPVHRG